MPDAGTTASGYKKRVRGANVPRTEVTLARGEQPDESSADGADVSTAATLGAMLSGFQAGAERAQAESDPETEEDR